MTWLISIDERRSRSRPSIAPAAADQARQGHPGGAIAEAAEVDAGEHDLAVALRRPPPDLAEHGLGRAAAGGAAHERDDAERAREGAAVLDLDERAHALEPVVRLHAADRPHVGGDGVGDLLAAPATTRTLSGMPGECALGEVRGAPRHVDAVCVRAA